jgi:hypothetical protein
VSLLAGHHATVGEQGHLGRRGEQKHADSGGARFWKEGIYYLLSTIY